MNFKPGNCIFQSRSSHSSHIAFHLKVIVAAAVNRCNMDIKMQPGTVVENFRQLYAIYSSYEVSNFNNESKIEGLDLQIQSHILYLSLLIFVSRVLHITV